MAEDGKVTSRFETPFKRETLAALAATSGQGVVAPETGVVSTAVPEVVEQPIAEPVPEAVVEAAPEAVADLAPEAVVIAQEPVAEAVMAPAPEPVAEPEQAAVVEPAAAPESVVEPAAPVVQVVAEPTLPAPVTITVQPGFTLWGIADSMMGDGILYVQVFEMNKDKIRNPDLIYPGQVFMVPQE
jgi:nucleoid-associated protein YgaU